MINIKYKINDDINSRVPYDAKLSTIVKSISSYLNIPVILFNFGIDIDGEIIIKVPIKVSTLNIIRLAKCNDIPHDKLYIDNIKLSDWNNENSLSNECLKKNVI